MFSSRSSPTNTRVAELFYQPLFFCFFGVVSAAISIDLIYQAQLRPERSCPSKHSHTSLSSPLAILSRRRSRHFSCAGSDSFTEAAQVQGLLVSAVVIDRGAGTSQNNGRRNNKVRTLYPRSAAQLDVRKPIYDGMVLQLFVRLQLRIVADPSRV